jgi:hypothetical protein
MMDVIDSLFGIAFCVLSFAYVYRSHTRHKGNDTAGSERSFIIGLLFLLLAVQARAQGNWRILVERDTMAIGPLQDVRKWAGLRMAKNDMARQCAWELVQRNKELAGLYAERDACMDKVTKARKVMEEMRDTQEALNDRANRWQRKAKRRNPVLWMGIGAGAMLLIQQQLK